VGKDVAAAGRTMVVLARWIWGSSGLSPLKRDSTSTYAELRR
jgi:hypothetical protein